MTIYNTRPRPRVIFEDVPDDLLPELQRLVPSSTVAQGGQDLHESEYDLLVTFNLNAGRRSTHLHVLSFGAEWGESFREKGSSHVLQRRYITRAHEMSIPPELGNGFASLLEKTLIPHIVEGEKTTWTAAMTSFAPAAARASRPQSQNAMTGDLKGFCQPLIHIGREKFVYAFSLRRRAGGKDAGLMWVLPPETAGHAQWLKFFLSEVEKIDPGSVPLSASWKTNSEWTPPALRESVLNLRLLQEERTKAIAQYDDQERELENALFAAGEAAAAGPQRLLTADGDDLVDAVKDVLQALGFTVQDMDDHHAEKTGAKLEDLRVGDPTMQEWICLAEIKGYQKGAKVSDVAQITARPVVSYVKETGGKEPSSVWHIVNAWRRTDPTTRAKAIDNDEVDLMPLTVSSGALIDTRDLFRAWRDVQDGLIGKEQVRQSLRSARTRWSYEVTSPRPD